MRIAKKLLGAKKAWKSFTAKLQSNLNISNAKRYAARVLTGLCSIRRLVSCKRLRQRRLRPPFKKSYSAVMRYDHHYQRCCDQQQQLFQKGFAAIYVDQLFEEGEAGETGKGKQVVAESSGGGGGGKAKTETEGGGEKGGWTFSDAWKAALAASPQFRSVDERAEEFISKFHKNVELERGKSFLDFKDMLERSA